jgi:hypothetical protein
VVLNIAHAALTIAFIIIENSSSGMLGRYPATRDPGSNRSASHRQANGQRSIVYGQQSKVYGKRSTVNEERLPQGQHALSTARHEMDNGLQPQGVI